MKLLSNWISVKEQKPEKWKRVLLYSPYEEKIVIGTLINNGWGLDTTYVSDHCHSGYSGGRTMDNFTHWQPLPELPK